MDSIDIWEMSKLSIVLIKGKTNEESELLNKVKFDHYSSLH